MTDTDIKLQAESYAKTDVANRGPRNAEPMNEDVKMDERGVEAAARALHNQQEIEYDWEREWPTFFRQSSEIIRAYLAATKPPLADVTVKALEWRQTDKMKWDATSPAGDYTLRSNHTERDDHWMVMLPDGDKVWDFEHLTFAAAKAVAQADYERRILSALASPPMPGRGEGFVLVPVEITLEMQKAYFDVIDKNMERVTSDPRFGRFDSNREAYRAMLAASRPKEDTHAE